MAPRKLRKALGAVKDQTSIAIANVGGTKAPDLDIALVKATSHDESPVDDKYVQEILHLTSYSRGYVAACVAGLGKRLGKTHNWIVALKTLILIHRLLREGDPSFEQELLRRGMRMLNLSHFRDDSHSNAWDYSAFVRTYALFLDERLDSSVPGTPLDKRRYGYERSPTRSSHGTSPGGDRRSSYVTSPGSRDDSGYTYSDRPSPGYEERRHSFDGGRSSPGDYRDRRLGEEDKRDREDVAIKEMKVQDLLDKLPILQRLMDRVLGCRPTGAAKSNRLVQIALYPMVRESFQLYSDICDGITILLDKFFDMEQPNCIKTFEIYNRTAKQGEELASFYGICKNFGIGRSSEYPTVQKVSQEHLDTLEDFLRDRSRAPASSQRSKSPEPQPLQLTYRPQTPEQEPEASSHTADIHVEASPPRDVPQVQPVPVPVHEGDLLNLDKASISPQEQEDKLALALFSGASGTASNSNWATFNGESDQARQSNGAWQPDATENGKAGWELALVASTSNLSQPATGILAGGFDPLLLNSMYDQGAVRQKQASAAAPSGSASSVALPHRPASSFLALPAPPGGMPLPEGGEDPFAASAVVPPPSYVQMADMNKKQQLLSQEQQLWQQYQMDGMRGEQSLMRFSSNPYGPGMMPPNGMALPYYGVGMPVQNYHASY